MRGEGPWCPAAAVAKSFPRTVLFITECRQNSRLVSLVVPLLKPGCSDRNIDVVCVGASVCCSNR